MSRDGFRSTHSRFILFGVILLCALLALPHPHGDTGSLSGRSHELDFNEDVVVTPPLSSNDTLDVSPEIQIERNNDFDDLHPGEKITFMIMGLDTISAINLSSRDMFIKESIQFWAWESDHFAVPFTVPDHEEVYTLSVTGEVNGTNETIQQSFTVEAFELFIYPETSVMIKNVSADTRAGLMATDRSDPSTDIRADESAERVRIFVELVDWKGDPKEGDVTISVFSTDAGIGGDSQGVFIEDFQIHANGLSSFDFIPEVWKNTTLYNFQATYLDRGEHGSDEVHAECGLTVHPFLLAVDSDRIVLEGGGGYVNGPYLQREKVDFTVLTSGTITSLDIQDIISHEPVGFTHSNLTYSFKPQNASVYEVRIQAQQEGLVAEIIMMVPVNDWPIEIMTPICAVPGEHITIDIQRDNGEFFGVRALLFNESTIPVSAILEVVEDDSSDSPFYEKALLDRDGKTTLKFTLPTSMRSGEYQLAVGLGSWDRDEITFHGIGFSTISISHLEMDVPEDAVRNNQFEIKIMRGCKGEMVLVNGSITSGNSTWAVIHGVAALSFDTLGSHECLVSETGKDVSSFTISVYQYGLVAEAPSHILADQEFRVLLTNSSGSPLKARQVLLQVTFEGTIIKNGMYDLRKRKQAVSHARNLLYGEAPNCVFSSEFTINKRSTHLIRFLFSCVGIGDVVKEQDQSKSRICDGSLLILRWLTLRFWCDLNRYFHNS